MAKNESNGYWTRDRSGVFHFRVAFGHVTDAAEAAIKTKTRGARIFWFNDTPAPITKEDTAETLVTRWREWREAYQQNTVNDENPCAPFLKKFLEWRNDGK